MTPAEAMRVLGIPLGACVGSVTPGRMAPDEATRAEAWAVLEARREFLLGAYRDAVAKLNAAEAKASRAKAYVVERRGDLYALEDEVEVSLGVTWPRPAR